MKYAVFMILLFPTWLLAQPDSLFALFETGGHQVPSLPEGAFDLNQDGIPEIRIEVQLVGTEDVPSSSGCYTVLLRAEPHCQLLYGYPHQYQYGSVAWWEPMDSLPIASNATYHWVTSGEAALLYHFYGNSPRAGIWIRAQEGRSDCTGVKFVADGVTWMGWITWRIDTERGEISMLTGKTWEVEIRDE